jgi:hypothetical protein
MAETSLDYQTLRNYAYVARRFPESRRRTSLSFQHHAEVTSLDDPGQDTWLSRAETLKWPLHEFRRQLRGVKAKAGTSPEPEEVTLSLIVSSDQYQRWSAAAGKAQQGLLEWAAEILDRASVVGYISVQSRLPVAAIPETATLARLGASPLLPGSR